MGYFHTKSEIEGRGTLWHEFFPGKWNENVWNEDSLYIHDDVMHDCGLTKLLRENVHGYDMYGVSTVRAADREKLFENAEGSALKALEEIDSWMRSALEKFGELTILGI